MTTPFAVASQTKLLAQPSGGGKFYFRSTNSADTGNLSVTGLVGGVSTTDTAALAGGREVATTDTFTSITGAILAATQLGTVRIYQSGAAASGSIVINSQPANNDTIQIGLNGFVQLYTFKTALTGAANEVLIGASVSTTATHLYEAINAGANIGTDYGTGTVANPYVTAGTPGGASFVFTDKIACNRNLGWSVSQTVGSTLSIVAPIGGVDGTLLGSMSPGSNQLYNNISLASENLGSTTLPSKAIPTTDSILVNGKSCVLRFKASGVSSSIALKYQTSTDNTNWADGVTSITSLTNSHTILAPQYVVPGEKQIEYIRLVFTANANTADTTVDARVIMPRN